MSLLLFFGEPPAPFVAPLIRLPTSAWVTPTATRVLVTPYAASVRIKPNSTSVSVTPKRATVEVTNGTGL